MKHAGGRPTEYKEEILTSAREYLDNLPEDEVVHSIEGLSDYIKIARSTIYDWISQDSKQEFSYIVSAILSKQGKTLVNKGLDGKFNSSIAKLMMTKHGYRDAVDTDLTSKGESITITSEALAIAKKYEEDIKKTL